MNLAKNLDFEEEKVGTSIDFVKSEKPQERKHITSFEEYINIPKERRDKAAAEMKHFFDNADTLVPEAIKIAVKERVEKGLPIAYGEYK